MRSAVDLLYYAPGDGMGHATRAAAILRQVRRLTDRRLLAVITTPHARPLECESLPYLRAADPAPEALRGEITARAPRLLAVDTFPFGIAGELAELPCRAALVARRLQARYAEWGAPAWHRFDRVLLAEECGDAGERAVACCPILLRDAEELWPRERAKAALGVGAEEPVALGVSSDDIAWTQDFFHLLRKVWRRLRPDAALRLASPHLEADDPLRVDHYPLLDLFNGVDLVIGPCGYNLFHEARACEIPAIFLPRPRRFDDQEWRARDAVTARTPDELEAHLRRMMPTHARPRPAAYHNGARAAARALVAELELA